MAPKRATARESADDDIVCLTSNPTFRAPVPNLNLGFLCYVSECTELLNTKLSRIENYDI